MTPTTPTAPGPARPPRYAVALPVPGGSKWFEVSDMKRQFAVVSIFEDVPGAEEICRNICATLNSGE